MSASTSLRHSGTSDESSSRRARKALLRDIDRDLKKKAQATVADLRARLRAARAAHQEALKSAVTRCREHRLAVREKLQAERTRALAELRAKGEAERGDARGTCALDKSEAEKATRGALEGARAELTNERTYQEGMKWIERGNRASSRTGKRTTAAERGAESDNEVRGNIPPEFVSLFDRVKRSIKGGARETRTAAFLRYAEEHPSEYLDAIEDKTEALIRDLDRQEREAMERRRNPGTVAAARKQYERDHWGRKGTQKAQKLPAADPRIPCVELGELVAIVYRTKKGEDRVLTDYEHEFEHPRPRLAYNESGLVIAGGRYRIEERGIVDQ